MNKFCVTLALSLNFLCPLASARIGPNYADFLNAQIGAYLEHELAKEDLDLLLPPQLKALSDSEVATVKFVETAQTTYALYGNSTGCIAIPLPANLGRTLVEAAQAMVPHSEATEHCAALGLELKGYTTDPSGALVVGGSR
jgi:hypothetical protein